MGSKVSVILPNYNHAAFLKERIDSILNQTYKDFELVILDDCSSDDSREIIESYRGAAHVTHIIYNEKNSGSTFKQWRKGIALTNSDYIWIAESDDYCVPEFLERCVKELEANPELAYCLTGSYVIDENGEDASNLFSTCHEAWKKEGITRTFKGLDYIKHNLSFSNYCYNASMVVFRRTACQKISSEFSQFRYAGDWLFWIEMAHHGDLCVIQEKLNYWRHHRTKVSNEIELSGENKVKFLKEDILVRRLVFSDESLNMSLWLRGVLRGTLYKIIIRANRLTDVQRKELLDISECSKTDWILARINKTLSNIFSFFPTLRTYRR